MGGVTNPQPEPETETVDGAIVATHLDGTEERFPVTFSRQVPQQEKEK